MKKIIVFITAALFLTSTEGCAPDRSIPTPLEQNRPLFEQMISPADSAYAFDRAAPLVMRFSEAMDPKTFPGNFHFWQDALGENEISGTFTAEENTVIFRPDQQLQGAKEYFTELNGRVQDIHGNGIEKDTSFVMSSEFFTSGENFTDSTCEYFICSGYDDRLTNFKLHDQLLLPEDAMELTGFGRQLEIASSKDGKKFIMSDYNTSNSAIYLINPETYQFEATLKVNPNGAPAVKKSAEIVISDTKAYVINQSNKLISVVDLTAGNIESTIALPSTPKGMAISPNFDKIYVGAATLNKVWVINTQSGSVVETWSYTDLTRSVRLAVSTDGNTLMVREFLTNNLFFIKTADGLLLEKVDLGYPAKSGNNNDLAVAGNYLYATSAGTLQKIDIDSRSVVAENAEVNFQGIDIDPYGEVLIATIRENPAKLGVLLPDNLKLIRKIDYNGTAPWDVAIRLR